MKHNTNTNTKQSKKTASKSQPNTRVYESVTREAMAIMALDIAKSVHTCKQASAHYAQLADRFGSSVAKEILAMAKTHVKARVQAVADDAKSVQERLRDGEKIAKSAWQDLLTDESVQGRQWARAVYESAGCDLQAMAVRYADFVAIVDGREIVAKRTSRKGANGERESGYAPMSQSVGAWLSALKTAVKNAKKSALGACRSDYQRTVELTWEA